MNEDRANYDSGSFDSGGGQSNELENLKTDLVMNEEHVMKKPTVISNSESNHAILTLINSLNVPMANMLENGRQQRRKVKRFTDFLTTVLSIAYAMALVSLGFLVYAYDTLSHTGHHIPFATWFNLYLSVFGIIWLSYLLISIRMYVMSVARLGSDHTTLRTSYSFLSGRHDGSVYLKIGAGFFCAGHIIHSGLNFFADLSHYLTVIDSNRFSLSRGDAMAVTLDQSVTTTEHYDNSTSKVFNDCQDGLALGSDIIIPIFSIVQLITVTRFGHTIVQKGKGLARFGFMHCIASSLCFWMHAIMKETVDSLVAKYYFTCDDSGSSHSRSCYTPEPCHPDDLGIVNQFFCVIEARYECTVAGSFATSMFNYGSLLYPFTIEFSILVAGVWYVMWSNVGTSKRPDKTITDNKNKTGQELDVDKSGENSAAEVIKSYKLGMVIHADLSKSAKGLFVGVFFLVLTVVICVVVFVMGLSDDDETIILSVKVANVYKQLLLVIMITANIFAYREIVRLDVNPHSISFLDDLLLVICLPSFFFFFHICIYPAMIDQIEPFTDISNILNLAQVLIQTPMIIDGLRRCSKHIVAKEKKASQNHNDGCSVMTIRASQMRGQTLLMLLIILNLAVYLMETLLIKTNTSKIMVEFYGPIAWTALSHMALPLCIFYRFHSSVALVDIWKSAYDPPEKED